MKRRTPAIVTVLLIAGALVFFVAPLADPDPDGLEHVSDTAGLGQAVEPSTVDTPLADYGVKGVEDARMGPVTAGIIGTVAAFGAGLGLVALTRRRRAT